ncbi:unnamed protein product [Dovyalis caffra]|uniref:Uncharacterized protein n=1 Tax=Dovyalis caffra TaxID=77055 RepID=A0AAV1RDV1_9ROSI|nr:unnamed protein product [Dovyalis caffra]
MLINLGWVSTYMGKIGLFLILPIESLSLSTEDIEIHRGKPLYLNEERYAALAYMFIDLVVHVRLLLMALIGARRFSAKLPSGPSSWSTQNAGRTLSATAIVFCPFYWLCGRLRGSVIYYLCIW